MTCGIPVQGKDKYPGSTNKRKKICHIAAFLLIITFIWIIFILLKSVPPFSYVPYTTSTPTHITEDQSPIIEKIKEPIVWMYVPPDNAPIDEVMNAAEKIAWEFSTQNEGWILIPTPVQNMASIVQALCDGVAQIGSLDGFSYLVASERGCADVKLIWNAYGDIAYRGELLVKSSSMIRNLSDLNRKILCIPSYDSISSWILPSMEFKTTIGDPFSYFNEIIEMESHENVLDAVNDGSCDAGIAYYDVRESSTLPDVMDVVIFVQIYTSMPNQNISLSPGTDPDAADLLTDYFLSISAKDNALAIISGYGVEMNNRELVEINDRFYSELRYLLKSAGENSETYLQ